MAIRTSERHSEWPEPLTFSMWLQLNLSVSKSFYKSCFALNETMEQKIREIQNISSRHIRALFPLRVGEYFNSTR